MAEPEPARKPEPHFGRFLGMLAGTVFLYFAALGAIHGAARSRPIPAPAGSGAAQPEQAAEALLVRTMTSEEFRPKFFGPVTWIDGGKAYLALEPSSAGYWARDIVG